MDARKALAVLVCVILFLVILLHISGTFTLIYNKFTGEGADTDGDGMPDAWETLYNFDPNDMSDANQDDDGDGYTNLQEYQQGTNPILASDHPEGDGVETKVYVTVYSDSAVLQGVEVNLDSVENVSYWVGAFTNNEGVAIFSEVESDRYQLFVKINGEWKGGDKITVGEGSNYFTFLYYSNTDTWEIE